MGGERRCTLGGAVFARGGDDEEREEEEEEDVDEEGEGGTVDVASGRVPGITEALLDTEEAPGSLLCPPRAVDAPATLAGATAASLGVGGAGCNDGARLLPPGLAGAEDQLPPGLRCRGC